MSRKLVTTIQDIKGIPGKHKRVLLAWAAFANNDGTNIFPGKEKVAQKAGIVRETVYRNTNDLIAVGILKQASSHTCKTPVCHKDSIHLTGKNGQWTVAYEIDVVKVQNVETPLLLKSLKPPSTKQLNLFSTESGKPRVANCHATQALEVTPVSLEEDEAPIVASGLILRSPSDEGKQTDSVAFGTPARLDEGDSESKYPIRSDEEEAWLLLNWLFPNKKHSDVTPKAIEAIVLLRRHIGCYHPESFPADPARGVAFVGEDFWKYNRSHHALDSELYFRSMEQFIKTLENFDDNGGFARYARHFSSVEDSNESEKCLWCHPELRSGKKHHASGSAAAADAPQYRKEKIGWGEPNPPCSAAPLPKAKGFEVVHICEEEGETCAICKPKVPATGGVAKALAAKAPGFEVDKLQDVYPGVKGFEVETEIG